MIYMYHLKNNDKANLFRSPLNLNTRTLSVIQKSPLAISDHTPERATIMNFVLIFSCFLHNIITYIWISKRQIL